MTKFLNNFVCFFSCLVALSLVGRAVAKQTEEIDFEKQIRPLLIRKCAECHGPDDQTSDLRLDSRHSAFKGGSGGPVIVAGDAKASELIRRITASDGNIMPPDGEPLSNTEIKLLQSWIDEGANWPESDYDRKAKRDPRRDHWALQPVGELEALKDDMPYRGNSVDPLIENRLKENGLKFSPSADRRTLIRRLSMDLLGLPPTPEQIQKFIEDDDPKAALNLTDRLLASPRYGERWAQHWLDLVRYADTHGFEVNTPRENAWRYRDYVIQAFNEDKPYDRFVMEQLAGDAMDADEATGFLVAAAVLLPGQIGQDDASKRQARQDELDEIIVGTSATFLGLTIGCARCHDHKFDPISQRDYYTLQAFFSGVHYGDRPLRNTEQKQRLAKAKKIGEQIRKLELDLRLFEPRVAAGRTLVINERDNHFATLLTKESSVGANPTGTKPGYRDDVGTVNRIANISKGYTFWYNQIPGKDFVTYEPDVEGQFRLWVSWGAHGSEIHTRDARFVLDADGDLKTRDDQKEIARIDQRRQAGADEVAEQKPLWSGLKDVGVVTLDQASKIILRSGETGTGISADVIVLQEVGDGLANSNDASRFRGADDFVTDEYEKLPHLRSPVNARMNVEQFEPVSAKFVRFTTFETTNNSRYEPCIDELEIYGVDSPEKNIALASHGSVATSSGNLAEAGKHQLKHVNDGVYGNDRSWISNQKGSGWIQIELPVASSINRIVWQRDRNLQFADRLPIRYRFEVSVDGKEWKTISSHDDRQPFGTPYSFGSSVLRRLPEPQTDQSFEQKFNPADVQRRIDELAKLRIEKQQLEKEELVYAGVFREPHSTFVLGRGDPEQKLASTMPATPEIFTGIALLESETDQQRRLKLAKWIASAENPLTARVMVNRIWQYHFGRGLVATSSDFGLNGQPPSHPELLDWLAHEFVESGWSVKHIHRLILNSRTYQQSSVKPAGVKRDDKWLWRFPSRRIEAEAIRDSMLAVSGELNLETGGKGFDFFKSRGGLTGFPPVDKFKADGFRRMIYSHKVRMEKTPVFGAFDCPDAGQPTPERGQSTTAIQALNLFNSPFVIERANQYAARVKQDRPDDLAAQIEHSFQLAVQRKPNATESEEALKVCEEHGLETLCRVLFNTNEFLFIQ